MNKIVDGKFKIDYEKQTIEPLTQEAIQEMRDFEEAINVLGGYSTFIPNAVTCILQTDNFFKEA